MARNWADEMKAEKLGGTGSKSSAVSGVPESRIPTEESRTFSHAQLFGSWFSKIWGSLGGGISDWIRFFTSCFRRLRSFRNQVLIEFCGRANASQISSRAKCIFKLFTNLTNFWVNLKFRFNLMFFSSNSTCRCEIGVCLEINSEENFIFLGPVSSWGFRHFRD